MIDFFPEQAVFFRIGDVAIRWYGLAYAVSFWAAWAWIGRLGTVRGIVFSRDQWTMVISLGALGALVGGRIGYAALYEPGYFLSYPMEIVRIWHGGMSSHGGFLGAMIGGWIAVRLVGTKGFEAARLDTVLAVADVVCIPAAFGLAIGRMANVLNGEFGMYPIYEAAADFGVGVVCYVLLRLSAVSSSRGKKGALPGTIFAVFLILYSIARFLLEYVRVQEWPALLTLARGQLYTIPLLLAGVLLLAYAKRRSISSKIQRVK